jgi:hypothetical protein
MKPASLKEIKTELKILHPARLQEICIQVARFKKENKELLSYLLFESEDEQAYIRDVKLQLDELFKEVKKTNSYIAKKTVRKILAFANKQIKYSGQKQTEVEIVIHFCKKLRKSGISLPSNTVLGNIYLRQVLRIKKSLSTLHEDLQFDYSEELKLL